MATPDATPAGELGLCEQPWCDRPAAAYVAGPTLGRSPRVTVIGGERAAQLARETPGEVATMTYGAMQCVDCLLATVEAAVGHGPAGPAPLVA